MMVKTPHRRPRGRDGGVREELAAGIGRRDRAGADYRGGAAGARGQSLTRRIIASSQFANKEGQEHSE